MVVGRRIAGRGLDRRVDPKHELAEHEDGLTGRALSGIEAERAFVEGREAVDVGGEERQLDEPRCGHEPPQRRNSTVRPPRAAQALMPPSSTGRASKPARGEERRRDPGTGAALADRHDGPVGR